MQNVDREVHMPRYSSAAYERRFPVDTKSVTSTSKPSAAKASEADMWRLIGDVAPFIGMGAGGLLGSLAGPIGTTGGATIGAALGGGAGALAKGHGDSLTAKEDTEAENKERRRQEMIQVLMGLR
jgi:hypothetical protein